VWLEMSKSKWTDQENRWYEEEFDEPIPASLFELASEPYWRNLRAILASLDAQGTPYEISFDNEDGRGYALVTTMPPASQLSLEDPNVTSHNDPQAI
jgi:hypothetical protein